MRCVGGWTACSGEGSTCMTSTPLGKETCSVHDFVETELQTFFAFDQRTRQRRHATPRRSQAIPPSHSSLERRRTCKLGWSIITVEVAGRPESSPTAGDSGTSKLGGSIIISCEPPQVAGKPFHPPLPGEEVIRATFERTLGIYEDGNHRHKYLTCF